MIRVHGFKSAAAKRAGQHFKENTQSFCLTSFQDLIGRIVPITSVGRFVILLAPRSQEMCILVRTLILPWDGVSKGAEGFLPDRGLRLSKGDSYINILGYVLCLEII